jgi:hypothetical protein
VARARGEMEVDIKIGSDDIAELRKLVARLEEVIEQGRGLLKDLRAERTAVRTFIRDEVQQIVERETESAVHHLHQSVKEQIVASVKKVDDSFMELKDLYMGRSGRPAGEPTIEDLTAFAKVIDHMKREGKMPEWLI